MKDIQSGLELGGFCIFLIHIFITAGGNKGLLSLLYLFPAKSFYASGFSRSPAHPSDKALSPEEWLPRVHAPCLVCSGGCGGWRNRCQWEPLRNPRGTSVPLPAAPWHCRAIPENHFFEEKVYFCKSGPRGDSRLQSRDLLGDVHQLLSFCRQNPGRDPGPGSRRSRRRGDRTGRRRSGDIGAYRRCRADALLWKLGKYPRKYAGAGLERWLVRSPPVGAGRSAGCSSEAAPCRTPPAAAREPLSLLSMVLTLWEMLLTEPLGAGDPRSQILHLVHTFGG